MGMSPSTPYLVRALYQWVLDNGCTPHLVVDARHEGASVPTEYVQKDGQIVLNVSPKAVRGLSLSDDGVEFSGRFGGVAHEVYAPMGAILAIYAKENGEGMWFPAGPIDPSGGDGPPSDRGDGAGPKLRLVK